MHATAAALDADKLEERFDVDGARFVLRLPAERSQALKARLRDTTRDRVRFED